MLGAGALGRPRGILWGGRREEGSGWGTPVYLWQIHFDIWQNQYNIVKLKNKIKIKNNNNKKRLFSSSSLSAIRVGSSAYLWLLIFLLVILIPACASSSPAFSMMYSAYKLNKQGDNI